MKRETNNSPTLYQISTLEEGFNLLNKFFFENKLPHVIINQQHNKSPGYFLPNRWKAKKDRGEVHEINLTPSLMIGNNKAIISTLLHQMVHLWQYCHGEAPRAGYHDKQWAHKMISVGLQPIAADNANKMTGQKVTHVIIKDGPFDKLINESSFQIRYYSAMTDRDQSVNKKRNKVKYTCSLNAAAMRGESHNYTSSAATAGIHSQRIKKKKSKDNKIV